MTPLIKKANNVLTLLLKIEVNIGKQALFGFVHKIIVEENGNKHMFAVIPLKAKLKNDGKVIYILSYVYYM